eukprot:6193274-Pleurochrysis_carterae.AAC.1
MMRVITSRRRLYPGLVRDPSSRCYRETSDSLVRACELERARILHASTAKHSSRPPLSGDVLAPPDDRVTTSTSAARPDSFSASTARPDLSLPSAARPDSSP